MIQYLLSEERFLVLSKGKLGIVTVQSGKEKE